MRVSLKELQDYRVETVSGVFLGKIFDLVFEEEGQSIVQYRVRSSRLIGSEYLVSRNQVVSFAEGKMTVDDAVQTTQSDTSQSKPRAPKVEPVSMREE